MSIEPLIRVWLIGAASGKADALARLQAAGLMHIDALEAAQRRAQRARPDGARQAQAAIRHLRHAPRLRAQVLADEAFDVARFIEDVLANREARRAARDRRDLLDRRIAQVAPFGDFKFPDSLDQIGGQRLWFYVSPLRALPAFAALGRPWVELARRNGKAHVVVLGPEPPPEVIGGAQRLHVGTRRLAALLEERAALDLELDELDLAREAQTRRLTLLQRDRAKAEDAGLLALAEQVARDEGDLFFLDGWAPARQADQLDAVAREAGCAIWAARAGPADKPPTLLRPPKLMAAGADLLGLYQLPGAREWDPSALVWASFVVFFAIITSDAGYSACLLAGCAALWGWSGERPIGRRVRWLWLAASCAGIVWGALVGSWFGATPPPDSLAGRLHMLSLNHHATMMQISAGIGVGHVVLANLGAAWAQRGGLGAVGPLGWAATAAAGFTHWIAAGTLGPWPMCAVAIGLGCVAIGAGGFWRGLAALTAISRLISDVLSYLRLFALGLAGSSLASTFNQLAADARAESPGFGLLAAVLILILGHGLNLTLAVMGGVVHGLRLNFIEFLGWGVREEGRPFVPFARQAGNP